ncbi:uncharacterized protein SOCE26_048500 [Sorangium cellulosum]|uniref:Uncharacterized protein n=1 Tax=Sorangium cellulosum TaxID=56 RepID=A0A2L0EVV2_SORCE|nr:hypothetical protein [Sorangium cellulosum]AUX43402.1 uncharacterized protein SOCE26_048500 [Sorangium cellulosum]
MSPFSDTTAAFLRRAGRGARGWTRSALVKWLRKQRAPVLEAHIAWEERLARMVEDGAVPLGSSCLLEVGDVCFGTAQINAPWQSWAVVRRDEGTYVLVGKNRSGNTRLYMDAQGRLARQRGALWVPLAASPVAHVERLAAKDGTAPWTLEVPRRVGAALAEALAVPRLDPASDELCVCWSGAHVVLLDGQWERPLAEATTIFVRDAAALPPLFEVLARLGLPAQVRPTAAATRAAEDVRREQPADVAEAPIALSYAAPTDACSGELVIEGSAIVQRVRDEKGATVERGVFAMDKVVLDQRMLASAHLAGRASARACAYLDAQWLQRDPRKACSHEALSATLRGRDLPVLHAALEFESWMGGFVFENGPEGNGYGPLHMLQVHDALGVRGGSDPPHPGGLQVEGDFPHTRWRWNALSLLPVGDAGGVRLYAAEDGLLYAHVRELDMVEPAAASARSFLEGLALEHAFAAMRLSAVEIAADMGEQIGGALGAVRDDVASDQVRSFWHAPDLLLCAYHGSAGRGRTTRVISTDTGRLGDAVRAALAADPAVKVGATHAVFDPLHAVEERVVRCF